MRFTVVVEEGESSFGAFVPDLPGCVAVGETREETLRLIKGAIELLVDVLLPEPAQHLQLLQLLQSYTKQHGHCRREK